jgi:hypothetical protein
LLPKKSQLTAAQGTRAQTSKGNAGKGLLSVIDDLSEDDLDQLPTRVRRKPTQPRRQFDLTQDDENSDPPDVQSESEKEQDDDIPYVPEEQQQQQAQTDDRPDCLSRQYGLQGQDNLQRSSVRHSGACQTSIMLTLDPVDSVRKVAERNPSRSGPKSTHSSVIVCTYRNRSSNISLLTYHKQQQLLTHVIIAPLLSVHRILPWQQLLSLLQPEGIFKGANQSLHSKPITKIMGVKLGLSARAHPQLPVLQSH